MNICVTVVSLLDMFTTDGFAKSSYIGYV